MCRLRKIEVFTIGQVREDQFVGQVERWVGGGSGLRERWDVVEEVIEMERQVVHARGGKNGIYGRHQGIVTVQRILALGGREGGGVLRWRGFTRIRRAIERVTQHETVALAELGVKTR